MKREIYLHKRESAGNDPVEEGKQDQEHFCYCEHVSEGGYHEALAPKRTPGEKTP